MILNLNVQIGSDSYMFFSIHYPTFLENQIRIPSNPLRLDPDSQPWCQYRAPKPEFAIEIESLKKVLSGSIQC